MVREYFHRFMELYPWTLFGHFLSGFDIKLRLYYGCDRVYQHTYRSFAPYCSWKPVVLSL